MDSGWIVVDRVGQWLDSDWIVVHGGCIMVVSGWIVVGQWIYVIYSIYKLWDSPFWGADSTCVL